MNKTTTKIVHSEVRYEIIDKQGYYDIVAKVVDGKVVAIKKVCNFNK
jgi:hypothetical protein